ncbi:DUF309 domain-containing protein [Nitratifractor sp.]
MPRENEDLAGALQRFELLLREGAYYEAHEVLEEAWHPLRRRRDPRRNLAKGLINAAIAFEHLRRAKPRSRELALRTIAAYDRYRPLCTGEIELHDAFLRCCETAERIRVELEI